MRIQTISTKSSDLDIIGSARRSRVPGLLSHCHNRIKHLKRADKPHDGTEENRGGYCSIGTVILKEKLLWWLAPSMRAASYKSPLMPPARQENDSIISIDRQTETISQKSVQTCVDESHYMGGFWIPSFIRNRLMGP